MGGGGQRLAGSGEAVDQAHGPGLLALHATTGEDEVEGVAVADEAGQPAGAAVDQGNAPAAAVDAEGGVGGGDPQVTPDRPLPPAGPGKARAVRHPGPAKAQPRRPPTARTLHRASPSPSSATP